MTGAGDAILLHAGVLLFSEVWRVPTHAEAAHQSPCCTQGDEHPSSPTPLAPIWGAAGWEEERNLGRKEQPGVVFHAVSTENTTKKPVRGAHCTLMSPGPVAPSGEGSGVMPSDHQVGIWEGDALLSPGRDPRG